MLFSAGEVAGTDQPHKKRHWLQLPQGEMPRVVIHPPNEKQERTDKRTAYRGYDNKDDAAEILIVDEKKAFLINLRELSVARVLSPLPTNKKEFETDELTIEPLEQTRLLVTRLPNTAKTVRGMTWLGWLIVIHDGEEVHEYTVWRFEETDD